MLTSDGAGLTHLLSHSERKDQVQILSSHAWPHPNPDCSVFHDLNLLV